MRLTQREVVIISERMKISDSMCNGHKSALKMLDCWDLFLGH